MSTLTPPAPATTGQRRFALIDADVHNAFRTDDQIARHLPAFFRQWGVVTPGRPGWHSPIGVARRDAEPEKGGPPGSSLAKLREQLLDPFRIAYAILNGSSTLGIGVWPEPDRAAATASAYNDALIETWLTEQDPRLRGSLLVASCHPQAAAREIRRVGAHEKIVQVIMTSATQIPLGDWFYWPIYEAACEMGLPVAVHPGAECTGIANPFAPGYPASYLEWHTNLSQHYMGQVTSLICRGVFCEFPALRFVCIEGGFGWVPHLMWRLDKNWKGLRVETPWLERAPSEYLLEHVRFTTQPIEEPEKNEHLLQIFEMMHAERTLMFSSDYPHWDGDDPRHAFPKLPDDLAERIFFRNAQELYGLPDPPAPGE